MAYEHWPYTNFHDLNLDWILGKMRELHDYVHENVDAIPEMQQDIRELDERITALYNEWNSEDAMGLMAKITEVIAKVIKTVFFELTDAGYFVAYIPDSWQDITFNTTDYDYPDPTGVGFGHLVLSY